MTKQSILAVSLVFIFAGTVTSAQAQTSATPTGAEIVGQCEVKNPGKDQRGRLTITLIDKGGNERKNIYLRLWKDYDGTGKVADKMVLFTEYPPDARGAAFLRWAFTPDADRNADQWLYLPTLGKVRPVSVREPGDSFLGSDLTYADISDRPIDRDDHKLLRVDNLNGEEFYVVESTPNKDKDKAPLYSKRIGWYKKTPDWSGCVRSKMEYYDVKGNILKTQTLTWQQINDAWLWKRVEVQNVQSKHSSVFEIDEAEINVGIADDVFTERTLQSGYKR